jgi:hypothetical protein
MSFVHFVINNIIIEQHVNNFHKLLNDGFFGVKQVLQTLIFFGIYTYYLERTRYLTMRAQQDTTFAAQLNEYNRKTSDNDNRNRELRRCYDNLITDEQYKAQNCRLCPSCKRVVQRLEGCDSMICGQDAHGGNLQSGCKTKFNWAQAQPYTAAATQQPKQTIVDLPKPENPVVHHNGVKLVDILLKIKFVSFVY